MSAPEPYTPEPGAILTLAGRLPKDGTWECRQRGQADNRWFPESHWVPAAIVEARPIPKPPLLMVEIPRDAAVAFVGKTEWIIPEIVAIADPINAALAAESES